MTKEQLLERMTDLKSCNDAIKWVDDQEYKTAQEIWDRCERGDWMLWYAVKVGVEPKVVGPAVCAVARTVLKYIPEGETRPLRCIEVTEAYWRGEATIEEVRQARKAAAYYAAYYAAYAADAADAAAYADARKASLKQSSDIVRAAIPKVPR
jgi:hypothetical protein